MKTNWYKKIFQYGILILLALMAVRIFLDKAYSPDFEAYCPFGGLQALGSFLERNSLSCSMTTVQILMGIALFAGIVLFGKLFCGYICPLGSVVELLGKAGDKLGIRRTLKGVADKIMRLLKYVLLFITFFFTVKSSELFCKKFDPYYALATGFDTDVVVLWALAAIILLFLGSVFIRMFWCRYLCPLGALSNIFRYTWVFLIIAGIYSILLITGLSIPYYYLLGVVVIAGYILEVFFAGKVKPNPVKITRNTSGCIDCKLCSKACPQGIDVAGTDVVSDIDCTMCGDCLYSCPEKDTLQINRTNKRWLPAAVIVLLAGTGILVSSFWELPTIDEKWGTPVQLKSALVYEQEGLKNIKCFGSSMAFANKMRRVPGVYGVATFVGSHSVRLYYDPDRYTEEELMGIIFVPQKKVVSTADNDVENLVAYNLEIDHFFDPLDASYLTYLLRQKSNASGFITEFACPVKVTIFFPEDKAITTDELSSIIHTRNLTYESGDHQFAVKLKYKVTSVTKSDSIISRTDYGRFMYSPLVMKFNKYSSYGGEILKNLDFRMGKNRAFKSRYSYLVSHVSNDKGVVAFETYLDDEAVEYGRFVYIDTITDPGSIIAAMQSDTLVITYSNGKTGKVENPFDFAYLPTDRKNELNK